jgi:arabinan endo-1,5-alpha-L-arabinosidase
MGSLRTIFSPLLLSLFLLAGLVANGQAQGQSEDEFRVHDPVMIRQGNTYYLFATGRGIAVWSSPDMKTWTRQPAVFETPPAWAVREIPGYKGHTWAPDIFHHQGTYYLYYSVSAFGKNTSAIGVATNTTLNPADGDYKWVDHGKVVQSVPGRDMWNAIDPNLILDEQGQPWLSFGSFWGGMKLVKLDGDLKKPAQPEEWYTLARRPREWNVADTLAGSAAIEAPFIFKKGKYYYLFVSYDYCCRGVNSTYKIMVGRSESVKGPYLDREGRSMLDGHATQVLEGNQNWHGVGHNSVYTFDGKDYLIFHGYDAADEGKPKLRIETLSWDRQGWPKVVSDTKGAKQNR